MTVNKSVAKLTQDQGTGRFHHLVKAASLPLLLLIFAAVVRGQSALDGFDPNANDQVRVVVVQPDGKILIGGDFTTLSPNGGATVTRNRIARLNPDGTLDTAFNPNANGAVLTIALQADGKILAGGFFSSIGGQTRNSIARLDGVTGLPDSFDPNANGLIRAIAVQPDGKILVGGGFNGANSIGGQARNRIARLDPTTGLADSFNPNSDGGVQAIVVQTDGKILVGGTFATIGGQSRLCMARLDGTTGLADSFDPNSQGTVAAIAVQPDGKILAGGFFAFIGGQPRGYIARLDPTTGLADSFNPNAQDNVQAIALQMNGKIVAGGEFLSIGGQARSKIARLDPTTGLADSFDPQASHTVYTVAIQADGKVLVGGFFNGANSVGGQTRNRIARLETDGRLDQTLDLDIAGSGIRAIAVQPDNKILFGGHFINLGGATIDNLGRLKTDGTFDTAFNPNPDSFAYAIAVQADGKILVGGEFTSIGGALRNRIARLDPITGVADSFDPNANDTITSIAVQEDGKILVGGAFTAIGGQTRNRIARLDATTGLADSFDPNANNEVGAIAVQPDGKIVVGGAFTNIGGAMRNRIARLDAASGLADSFNPNANDEVFSIAVQTDGKILAGGSFSGVQSIGGQNRNRIARLDATTGLADSFNPSATGPVISIAIQGDGKILVVGGFGNIGGQPRSFIARLDSTTGLADTFNPNADNQVNAIAVGADGKVLAGGSFNGMGGQTRHRFARLSNNTAALQSLTVTQTTITWTRGGSSPQFKRVTFASSSDNANYTHLGNGTLVNGSDWILTGLNLPTGQNVYIRARGYYPSGGGNGSESITESVRHGPPGPAGPTPTPSPTPTSTPTPTPTPTCLANPVVTTNADSGPGSLRQAIEDACPGGSITFNMNQVVSPIILSGPVGTSRALTINGPGADQLTISGNNNVAVFQTAVRSPEVVTLSGLSLVDGASPQGGIFHDGDGTLTIANSVVSDNGSSVSGGGVTNGKAGTINVINSTFNNNSAPGGGGGISNSIGTINVTNSTIRNNSSFFAGAGGGISNSSGTVSITNSTISGNSATAIGGPGSGGGIFNGSGGTLHLTNTTITNNSAGNGGGIRNSGTGVVQVWNSIVGLNTATNTGPDLNGAFITLGHNLIGRNDGSTGFTPGVGNPNGDLVGTSASPIDPRIGPLADNGGPTLTHGLQNDSLAIDAGDNAAITNPPFFGPPFYDQRGIGFPRIMNTAVDIGAFEVGPTPTPSPTSTPTPTLTPTPTPTQPPSPTPPGLTPTPTASPTPPPPTPTPSAPPTALGNIATRLRVETGDNVLIGGFIVTGTQPKKIIVRAIGPSLPLTGALADPVLELRDSFGGLIRSNDNWREDPAQESEIIATGIPPGNDLESAIVETLPANGSAYTAIVRGANNGTGIGVVEVYDLDQTVNSKLANISTRGFVQTGDDVMIGGLIVLGQNPLRVIVRAIGPSLPLSGALADPTLNLHDGNGTLVASNDNWRDDPVQESAIIATGIPPTNDLESAMVHNLTPGSYTAIVRGVSNTTGIAVVEAYALN